MKTCDIVFALRSDAVSKPGGDTSKVEKYRTHLAVCGMTSAVVHSPEDLEAMAPKIVHLMNIDIPIENLRYAVIGRRIGAKIALSTIAHPIAGIRKFYFGGRDTYFVNLRTLGIPFEYGMAARELVKLGLRADARSLHLPRVVRNMRFTELQQELLRACDRILPMNDSETWELRNRFHDLPPVSIVPNGASFSADFDKTGRRDVADVIVVGRVEPRKNTLDIAHLLRGQGVRVVFVGAPNEKHRAYIRKFRQIIDCDKDMIWLGRQPASRIKSLLAGSTVYLNLSWYEVVSQADIEATSQGCRVVTTEHSFIKDHLQISQLDPNLIVDEDRRTEVLDQINMATVPGVKWIPTWSDAGAALVDAYEDTMS